MTPSCIRRCSIHFPVSAASHVLINKACFMDARHGAPIFRFTHSEPSTKPQIGTHTRLDWDASEQCKRREHLQETHFYKLNGTSNLSKLTSNLEGVSLTSNDKRHATCLASCATSRGADALRSRLQDQRHGYEKGNVHDLRPQPAAQPVPEGACWERMYPRPRNVQALLASVAGRTSGK